jgi:hypothetical protein
MYDLWQKHQLAKLSVPTIYWWMHLLGFKYEPQKNATMLMGTRNLKQRRTERTFLNGTLNMKG